MHRIRRRRSKVQTVVGRQAVGGWCDLQALARRVGTAGILLCFHRHLLETGRVHGTRILLTAVSVVLGCAIPPPATIAADNTGGLRQTDVFVSGTDGYYTYRIPALLTTKKGTLLAFGEGRKRGRGDSGDIDLLVKCSTDGGRTWSAQQVIWDDGPNTCGNPCPVVDEKTGTIWLLLTHNLGDDKERDIKLHKARGTRTVWACRSTDDGKTWSRPVEITGDAKDPAWGWYATGPGVGIQIRHGPHKGRLVIPCDHSYDDPQGNLRGMPVEYGSHVICSDDRGKSWKLGGVIRPKVNECQVVELADGKGTLLLDMRAYFGRSRRAQSISHDGGLTWTAPQDHAELVEPVCQASLIRHSWPGRKEPSQILFSNPADEKRRLAMTVRLSLDEGKTWPTARVLHEGPAAYSCLARLRDGRVGCLYERGVTNAYEKITLATFCLSWLTGENR